MTCAEALSTLVRPEAYPEDASARAGVETVQTHISLVFLTRERVYKFRKPVNLGFVRFDSREERNADCLREVALNRRLAEDVYLGVAPLLEGPDGPQIGPLGESLAASAAEAPEHCVVMRRLPEGGDARSLLERGQLDGGRVDRIAARVAGFHREHGLGAPAPFSSAAWIARCRDPIEANFSSLGGSSQVPAAAVASVAARARAFFVEHGARLERRRVAGRAVDGHGDLHLEHVWFVGDERDPRIIDCVEFDDSLRRIDAASDVAFLGMDLRYRDHPELGERLLRVYARDADDFDLYAVVDFFASYRAAVRAKVAAIAAVDAAIAPRQRAEAGESARRHLALADELLQPRPVGVLVAVGGGIGTGKSTVAAALSEATGGVVISSDRLRKALHGLPPTARSGSRWKAGLYTPETTERVYAGLLERAQPVLESGRVAILDATHARRRHRTAVRRCGQQLRAETFFVEVRCARDVALERLERRVASDTDPSDAGPSLYDASRAEFEEAVEWPTTRSAVIATDSDWRGAIGDLARRIHAAGGAP